MEFGKLPHTELDKVDFTLPPDPETNRLVLNGERRGKVYLGLPQWGKVEWKGKLYAHKLRESDFLDSYVHHFNTVEVNATHYAYYGPARIGGWAHKAHGVDFKFLPKMHKDVTHNGPLAPRDLEVAKALDEYQYFGEHLGPVWAQLSDRYDFKKKGDLFHFFDSLDSGMPFFLEVRHPSWFEHKDLFDELRERKLGAIITDTAGFRYTSHMHLTIPKTMIRFVTNNLHPSDFDRVDAWAQRVKIWLDQGIEEVYFIIHMDDPINIIDLAQYAIQKFNEIADAQLKPLDPIV